MTEKLWYVLVNNLVLYWRIRERNILTASCRPIAPRITTQDTLTGDLGSSLGLGTKFSLTVVKSRGQVAQIARHLTMG